MPLYFFSRNSASSKLSPKGMPRSFIGQNLYVIGFDPTKQEHVDSLRRLQHSYALAVWEQGYDDAGLWDPERARSVAAGYVAEIARHATGRRAATRRRTPARTAAAPQAQPRAAGPVYTAAATVAVHTAPPAPTAYVAPTAPVATPTSTGVQDATRKRSRIRETYVLRVVFRNSS